MYQVRYFQSPDDNSNVHAYYMGEGSPVVELHVVVQPNLNQVMQDFSIVYHVA